MGLRAPNQFDLQRQQAASRINAGAGQQRQAMQRKFAQLGGGPSGASFKAAQNLEAQLGTQREDAMGGIGIAEAQDIARQREVEQGQKFQAGESALGRAQQESQFGRQFGLQQGGQQFDQGMANRQFQFQNKQFNAERGDQERNIAGSIANMNQGQATAYDRYLGTKGITGGAAAPRQAQQPRAGIQLPGQKLNSFQRRMGRT